MVMRLLIWCIMANTCSSNTEVDLQERLMSNYNVNVLPTKNRSVPIPVKVQMFIEALLSIDEQNEVITSKIYLSIQWKDEYLTWDPALYSNLTYTKFKQKQVWFPDLIIGNTITEYKLLGIDDSQLIIQHDGDVIWSPGVTATTICPINTRLFPFDEQKCSIELSPWTSSSLEIKLIINNPMTTLFTYKNGQWELVATSSELIQVEHFTFIRFILSLKRRSLYYITTIGIPVGFICILNCFTFLIPKQSGERVGYSITVFLSFVLILTIINGVLPKTSKNTSLFVIYIGALLTIALLTIVSSILSLAFESVTQRRKHEYRKHGESTNEFVDVTLDSTLKTNVTKDIDNEHDEARDVVSQKSQEMDLSLNVRAVIWLATYFESISFITVCIATILSTTITYAVLVNSV